MSEPIDMRKWRLVSCEDTRDFDFDSGKPVPGTGDRRPCDHCGRTIEIHAHIASVDGSAEMTVGTGCLGRGYGEAAMKEARNAYARRIQECRELLSRERSGALAFSRIIDERDAIEQGAWWWLRARDANRADRRAREMRVIALLS